MSFTRVCINCGREFSTKSDAARTCSNRCRQAAYRARRRRKSKAQAPEV